MSLSVKVNIPSSCTCPRLSAQAQFKGGKQRVPECEQESNSFVGKGPRSSWSAGSGGSVCAAHSCPAVVALGVAFLPLLPCLWNENRAVSSSLGFENSADVVHVWQAWKWGGVV